jgi:2-methylcitrate dehydratase PrpD
MLESKQKETVNPSKAAPSSPRGDALASYVSLATKRELPSDVIEASKQALADFVGCAVGSYGESAAVATRGVAISWKAAGNARIFCGPTTTPALAALVNGTMSHCMDYDDSHTGGAGHPSGPCWSTALAIASDRGLNEAQAISGFIAGYEVMTRLGARGFAGIGRTTARKGFHPTAIFGVTGAAACASVLLGLSKTEVANALGVAATSAGGLVASFGTDSKPFHPGKAAMEGILAAELAEKGFKAAHHLYEIKGGLLDVLIQDHDVQVPDLDFESNWEIFNNGYKPFACGRATHGSIQAAQSLR